MTITKWSQKTLRVKMKRNPRTLEHNNLKFLQHLQVGREEGGPATW